MYRYALTLHTWVKRTFELKSIRFKNSFLGYVFETAFRYEIRKGFSEFLFVFENLERLDNRYV